MARVVVLSFDDNQIADDYVRAMASARVEYSDAYAKVGGLAMNAVVEAVIARPTLACHCKPKSRMGGKRLQDWTRTQHFGWFVHARCKRPSALVVKNFIQNMLGGHNNLVAEVLGTGPYEEPPHIDSITRGLVQKQQTFNHV